MLSPQQKLQNRLNSLLPDLRKSTRFSPESISFLRVAVQMGEPAVVQRALDRLEALDDFVMGATDLALKVEDFTLYDLHLERIESEAASIRAALLASPEKVQAEAEKEDRLRMMSGLDYSDIYGVEPQWEPMGATSRAQAFRHGKRMSREAELDREFSLMEDLHEQSLFDSAYPHETLADREERLRKEETPTLESFLSFL